MGAVICYNDSWIYAHLSHDNYFESFPPHVKRLKRFMQLCVCVCVCLCVCGLLFRTGFKWNHNLVLLTVRCALPSARRCFSSRVELSF